MINRKLYLDTTIPVTRILGSLQEKNEINNIISKFDEICSSTYVKMEFNRTIMQTLIYLNNICYKEDKFSNIMEKIRKLKQQQNKMQRVLESMVLFFANFEKDKINSKDVGKEINEVMMEKIKTFLSWIIPIALKNFNKIRLSDETECALANIEPKKIKELLYELRLPKCDKSNINCKIIEFVKKNKTSFEKIYNKLNITSDLDIEQQKIKDILKNILEYPENIASRNNCWCFGDPVITVECPTNVKLYTTNLNHFQLLCDSVNKQLINNVE